MKAAIYARKSTSKQSKPLDRRSGSANARPLRPRGDAGESHLRRRRDSGTVRARPDQQRDAHAEKHGFDVLLVDDLAASRGMRRNRG